jgi:hypothetical protein
MRAVMMGFAIFMLSACGVSAGQPDGLYLMTRYAFGGLSTEAYRFDDGTVVRNPIAPEEQRAEDVGTYTIDGDSMSMTLGSNESSTSEIEAGDNGCFFWDMGNFCPVEGFDVETLDGTFTGGASVGGGAVSSAMTVTFNPDGTYTLSSLGAVSTSEASAGSSREETGTYAIDDTVLTLTPAGGASRTLTTFPYDNGSEGVQPRRMFFGGGMLKRIEKS